MFCCWVRDGLAKACLCVWDRDGKKWEREKETEHLTNDL